MHQYNLKKVDKLNAAGEVLQTYASLTEAGELHSISSACITNCIAGRQKTAAGFNWKYTNEAPEPKKPRRLKARTTGDFDANRVGSGLNKQSRAQALKMTDTITVDRAGKGWKFIKKDKTTKQVSPANLPGYLLNGWKLC